jgi:DNA-binding NtrC family response regulator
MASILVIDDDNLMRDMLIRMVALHGHDVKGAEDGWIAEKLLRDSSFDLVITDIIMPEKEGLETIIHIHKQYPATPIIAISGGERIEPESYLQIAKELGAHYTFAKPFNRHDFIKAINNCLNIKQTVM